MVGVCMYVYLCVKNIIPVTPPHLFPRLRNCWEDPAVTQGQCARCCAQITNRKGRETAKQEGEKERACAPLLSPPPFPPHIYDPTTHTLVLVDPLLPTANRSLVSYLVKCASWFSSNLGNVRPWTLSLASLSPLPSSTDLSLFFSISYVRAVAAKLGSLLTQKNLQCCLFLYWLRNFLFLIVAILINCSLSS